MTSFSCGWCGKIIEGKTERELRLQVKLHQCIEVESYIEGHRYEAVAHEIMGSPAKMSDMRSLKKMKPLSDGSHPGADPSNQ